MAFSGPEPNDGEELSPLADINVTPFIDVMLVLLIIFMVTAPMLATGMKVDLPKATSAKQLEPGKPVLVTIDAAGRIEVVDRIVSLEGLEASVRDALGGEERPIHVRADAAVAYGNVVAVLDALSAKGLPKFMLAFDRTRSSPGIAAPPALRATALPQP